MERLSTYRRLPRFSIITHMSALPLTQHNGLNPFATPSVDTPNPYGRVIIRTPSPSPSEQHALSGKKFKITDLLKKENWSRPLF
jgi:hypothetical protein